MVIENTAVENKEVEKTAGKFGIPGANENGIKLIGWCMEKKMNVRNMIF